jgi:hypothetical protein
LAFDSKKRVVKWNHIIKRKNVMITAADIVTAILSLYPYMSHNNRQCIIEHRTQIEQNLIASQTNYPEMPMEMIATIGFMETHLGCDYGEGGNWGAPISPTQRHVAGTPIQAATALWHGYERCHTWEGAARRFRTGLCSPTPVGSSYSRRAMYIVNRLRLQVVQQTNPQRICLNVQNSCNHT